METKAGSKKGVAGILSLRSDKLFRKLSRRKAGRSLVEAVRWPGGSPVCPCGRDRDVVRLRRQGMFRCRSCRRDFSVRTGTIFHASNIGLHKWVWAICMLAEEGEKITSVRLGRVLGVTQKTAWLMLERIRGPRRLYLHYLLGGSRPPPRGRGIREVDRERAMRMRTFARKRTLRSFRRLITLCG